MINSNLKHDLNTYKDRKGRPIVVMIKEDFVNKNNPTSAELAKAAIASLDTDFDLDIDENDVSRLKRGNKIINRRRNLKQKKNPTDPVVAFAAGTTGLLSALQIKKMLAEEKLKKTGRKANPDKVDAENTIPRRRTYEMFQGRRARKVLLMPVSRYAPERLDQLGDLIELKLSDGRVLRPNPKRFKLCAARGKLWIAGGRFAKPLAKGRSEVINPVAEIKHVVYGTQKDHLGDQNYTQYIHRLGEETGKRPMLAIDADGFPVIRGGEYKIESRGIVN